MPIFRKVTCRPFLIGLNWLYSSSGVKCFYDNPPFIIANRINDVYNKQEIIKNILNEIKVPQDNNLCQCFSERPLNLE